MTEKKHVLITGASRGIGRAFAAAAGKAGYVVAIHYNKNRDAAESCADEIRDSGSEARLLQFDISNREACRRELERDMGQHGAYYGVVANAGIARDNAFPAMSEEDWDAVLRTNLDGFYNVIHPVIMPMVRRRKPGRIVTVSSVSGLMGNRGQVNYSAAKAGIIGATKALAVELARKKITVNCIAPGIIDTEMIKDAPLDIILPQIPVGRVGTPEEVAAVVIFLLSSEASYITRQVLSVNGGLL